MRPSAIASVAPETVAADPYERLAAAQAPTCLLLPTGGVEQWDRPGEPLHDPEGLKAFSDEMVHVISPNTVFQPVDTHINDEAFAQAALRVFDGWVAAGLVPPGVVDAVEERRAA